MGDQVSPGFTANKECNLDLDVPSALFFTWEMCTGFSLNPFTALEGFDSLMIVDSDGNTFST